MALYPLIIWFIFLTLSITPSECTPWKFPTITLSMSFCAGFFKSRNPYCALSLPSAIDTMMLYMDKILHIIWYFFR